MSSSRTKVTANVFARPLDDLPGEITSIPAMWQCCWVCYHHRGKRQGKEALSTGTGSWIRRSESVTVILVPTGDSVMGDT